MVIEIQLGKENSSPMSFFTSPPPHFRSGKLVATLFIIMPLAMLVLYISLLILTGSVWISVKQPWAVAMAFLSLLLVFVSFWFLYAMVVSLWWDRRKASISFGLVFGLLLLSVFAFNAGDELLGQYRNDRLQWTTVAFGYLFFSSWLLTVSLPLHSMYGRRRV